MQTIIGQRVILFSLEPTDLDHFIKTHQEDKNGFLGRFSLGQMSYDEAKKYILALLVTSEIMPFTVITKEGKASRKAGYVYITDLDVHSCSISGIMCPEFAKGLTKKLKKKAYPYNSQLISLE